MTNFTLVCSAVADLTAVIVWRYNGERNPPDADIVTNRTHSILEIKSLTGRNSGIYNCSASNRYGRDSTAVNLQVQVPPTLSNFPSNGRDVVLGDPLVITCMAEGTPPPLVVWYKGNISLDNITDGANTATARLNITQFEEDDEGYYSCIAENSVGSINESLRVTIVERANITEISLNNEPSVVNNGSAGPVDEFRSLTLTCSATGKPVPSILWLRDGVTIGGSSRRTITSHISTTGSGKLLTISTLMVSQVILADEGMYTCRAVSGDVSPIPGQTAWTFQLDVQPRNECVVWNPCNSVGTMQCVDGSNSYTCICRTVGFFSYFGKNCSMKKDIRTPPEVIEQPKDQLNTTISSMVVLFCDFSGIPAPVVQWFKDDIDTKVEGQYFTIGAIKPADRGVYHCEAKNELANGKIGKAVSQKAMVLIQGLVQFQVTLMTSTQNPRQLDVEEIEDVTEQLRLLAAGTTFTTPAAVSGSLHSLEVYNSKSSTLLVTMVTTECCLPLQNFSAPFRMYLQQALQGYSDILKSTSFDVQSVQRHDGCPVDVSQVMACSSIGPVTWPETEIGDTASIPCPCGIMDPLIGNLMGNRTCGGSYTSGAVWLGPQCNECNFPETRNELCRLTQVDSPAQLALRLTYATNDAAQLEKEDVSASTVLLESVASQNITDDFDADYVQLDMLTTMDHLAGVSAEEVLGSQEVSNSSNRVLDLVEAITKRANASLIMNSSLEFIGAQLSLTVTEMSANSTENGVDLSPLIADQIEKIINDQIATKRGIGELPAASVHLPAGIFPSGNTSANSSRLALALYASGSLFQQRKNYTYSLYQDFAQVTGTIVSVSIVGEVINSGDLPEGEVVAFEFDKNEIGVERGLNGKCAFWQFEDDDEYGGWNTSGCNVTMETNTSIHCQCDHLTHFGILMDIFPERPPSEPSPPELQEALTAISIIGAIISITCFIIVSITYLANKTLRAEAHSRLLVNLCLSLTGLYITFIISTMDEVIRISPLCGTVGAMLHYFFLTTFFLMAADAALIYKKLVWVFKQDIPSYVAITGSIAWTLPVFLVAFSVAPNYKHYYNDKFCRAYGMPYYIGVLVPFGSIYIFNWVMFILTMTALTKRPALNTINSSKYQKWKKNFWVAVCLSVLFGLAWSLGLLASNGIPKAFATIFECAFTFLLASQGILLLIIYCLTSPEVRKSWKQLLLRGCRCCRGGLKRDRAKSSSQPTQSSKLIDTLSTSKNRPSDLNSPASPDSHTLSGYSATAASPDRPSNNAKSQYLYSTAIVSDSSVVGSPPIAVMDSVHDEETHFSRLPKDRATSAYIKRVNTGDIIELQPCTSETCPLIPAVAVSDKEPVPAGSPILVSVSEHSPDQMSAV